MTGGRGAGRLPEPLLELLLLELLLELELELLLELEAAGLGGGGLGTARPLAPGITSVWPMKIVSSLSWLTLMIFLIATLVRLEICLIVSPSLTIWTAPLTGGM